MDFSKSTSKLRPRWCEIQSLTYSSMKVRDGGYSPSPHRGIGKEKGYSPSSIYVSLCSMIKTNLFTFNTSSDLRSLLSSLHSSQALSSHTTLPFFPCSPRLHGNQIPLSVVRSRILTSGPSSPIPSINSWGGLSSYWPDENSFMFRGLFWAWPNSNPSWYWLGGG